MRKALFVTAAFLALGFQGTVAGAADLVARINIGEQTMTVAEDGIVQYRWKVSTARRGYHTPVGNYKALWLSKDHRSRKYNNAPMPYAVFFKGGYAVHGTDDLRRLGTPASHGCVRLDPANAAQFFALANRAGLSNTKIIITN